MRKRTNKTKRKIYKNGRTCKTKPSTTKKHVC